MSLKSCIGMIECVLRQQAAQPVGVEKLEVREALNAERVLIHTPLCVCFKSRTAFSQSLLLLVGYLIDLK